MSLRDRAKQVLRMCGHALSSTVHDRLDVLERELQATKLELRAAKLAETHAALLEASIHIVENLHALAGRTIVETEPSAISAEAALMAFLYSHVAARAAVEVAVEPVSAINIDGGDRERTEALLRAGYEVYALEAGQSAGEPVMARMNGGASNGSGVSGPSGVAVETLLGSPAAVTGAMPKEIGLLTLGCDPLPAVREFGDHHACVIAADLQTDFEELVGEMRSREYYWHIVLYRIPDGNADHGADQNGDHDMDHNRDQSRNRGGMGYYANHSRALPNSRGSVFFFRDYAVFAEAQAWCAATLPRTYFKPRQA